MLKSWLAKDLDTCERFVTTTGGLESVGNKLVELVGERWLEKDLDTLDKSWTQQGVMADTSAWLHVLRPCTDGVGDSWVGHLC